MLVLVKAVLGNTFQCFTSWSECLFIFAQLLDSTSPLKLPRTILFWSLWPFCVCFLLFDWCLFFFSAHCISSSFLCYGPVYVSIHSFLLKVKSKSIAVVDMWSNSCSLMDLLGFDQSASSIWRNGNCNYITLHKNFYSHASNFVTV